MSQSVQKAAAGLAAKSDPHAAPEITVNTTRHLIAETTSPLAPTVGVNAVQTGECLTSSVSQTTDLLNMLNHTPQGRFQTPDQISQNRDQLGRGQNLLAEDEEASMSEVVLHVAALHLAEALAEAEASWMVPTSKGTTKVEIGDQMVPLVAWQMEVGEGQEGVLYPGGALGVLEGLAGALRVLVAGWKVVALIAHLEAEDFLSGDEAAEQVNCFFFPCMSTASDK